MCIALPGQVKKINKNSAVVAWGKTKKKVGVDLIKNLKLNDWVIVQNNLIINKLSATQAQKILKTISVTNYK